MTFAATGLPAGLALDAQTGAITGSVAEPGTFKAQVMAKNAHGEAQRELRIVVGDQIALTPQMGWNSWNCFANAVTAEKVKAAADAMVKSGLIQHGWQYINIDDFWEVHKDSKDPTLQGPHRNAQGRIFPNPRFPDMKGLTDYIHSLGLKAGLYSSPGPWTCGGCVASFDHELLDATQAALPSDWAAPFEAFKHTTGFQDFSDDVTALADALYRRESIRLLKEFHPHVFGGGAWLETGLDGVELHQAVGYGRPLA